LCSLMGTMGSTFGEHGFDKLNIEPKELIPIKYDK